MALYPVVDPLVGALGEKGKFLASVVSLFLVVIHSLSKKVVSLLRGLSAYHDLIPAPSYELSVYTSDTVTVPPSATKCLCNESTLQKVPNAFVTRT